MATTKSVSPQLLSHPGAAAAPRPGRMARLAPAAARLLLGVVFTVFGLNGFLGFLPHPPMPPEAGAFVGALVGSGYLMTIVKVTELVAGILLLSNVMAPFALVLLAPIVVNIVAFHLFLAPAGLAVPVIVTVAGLGLAWHHRAAYAPLFRRAAPAPPVARSVPERAAA